MNLKEIKKPFEVDKFSSPKYGDCYDIVYINEDNERYDLFEDPNEETCKLVAALLNMYYFNKIDLKVLDLEQLNMISFLISQINKL